MYMLVSDTSKEGCASWPPSKRELPEEPLWFLSSSQPSSMIIIITIIITIITIIIILIC